MVTDRDFFEQINVILFHLSVEPRAQTNPSTSPGDLPWLWEPEKFPFSSCCPLCALEGTLFSLIRVANWLQPLSLISEGPQLLQVLVEGVQSGQRSAKSLEEPLIGMEGREWERITLSSERFSILMCQNILIQTQMGIHHSGGFTQLQVNN